MRDDDWIALQVAQARVVDKFRRREARWVRIGRALFRRRLRGGLPAATRRRSACPCDGPGQ
jgi:hypothetical protein